MKRALSVIIAAALAGLCPAARVDLVTLPQKDRTELTVYNSADLTLVREVRNLSFKKGKNEIQFNWAGVKIDPSSLELILAKDAKLTLLDAAYPKGTSDTVIWNIDSPEETSSSITVQYFLSGVSWSSAYNVILNADQTKLQLQESTTIANNSGEDLDDAVTRVVVGQLNFIETIEQVISKWTPVVFKAENGTAKDGILKANGDMDLGDVRKRRGGFAPEFSADLPTVIITDQLKAKEIMKKGVSEYQLFSVEGQETIATGWRKQLPNKPVEDVPFDLAYEIDAHKFGSEVPQEIIKLKNDTKHQLGKSPLPAGAYYVSTRDAKNGIRFEGKTDAKYFPVGEDIELNLGSDGMLLYTQRVMNSKRSDIEFDGNGHPTGWVETRSVELEVKNGRDRIVPVKLTHYIDGDWDFTDATDKGYTRVDKGTVRWESPVGPLEKKIFKYTITVRLGTKARS